jgi:hypothetical protein
LPHDLPRPPVRYGQAMASLIKLWRGEEILRRATYVQSGLFAAFSVFWTILALHLEQPPFQVGPEIAGAFGVLGAAGIVAAPIAGRLADRRGPRLAILFGAALACAAWLVFGLWTALPGLVLGVILLDFGVQSALISNQHVIYALAGSPQPHQHGIHDRHVPGRRHRIGHRHADLARGRWMGGGELAGLWRRCAIARDRVFRAKEGRRSFLKKNQKTFTYLSFILSWIYCFVADSEHGLPQCRRGCSAR